MKTIFSIALYCFALVGIIFTGVFVLQKFHLFDVPGSIDSRNAFFASAAKDIEGTRGAAGATHDLSAVDWCALGTIARTDQKLADSIFSTYTTTKDITLFQKQITAALGTIDTNATKDTCVGLAMIATARSPLYAWAGTPEWSVMSAALVKDKDAILRASAATGVSPRLIVASVISEQFRFFTSNRDAYKQYFEPLKILGVQSQFSFGVAGMKLETADTIEKNMLDTTSSLYPGADVAHVLDDSTGASPADTRLARLTDKHDHYYSYLYTGLFMREIMAQWQNAGYPVQDRPEILATLYNLGFLKSQPNANPAVGGAEITIADKVYTFGSLAYEFYYSGELSDIFPYTVH